MSFQPNQITEEHIFKAVERIEKENIDLKGATVYQVVINGKEYPPKEIMRYAHEEMNGEHIWEKSDGEPTNKFLRNLGFKITKRDLLTSSDQENINYWVFQGNPKVYDFEAALRTDGLNDWTVSSHKDKIKEGDKIIIWLTGNNSGCYALGEVLSEPYENSEEDANWKEAPKNTYKADIEITHNLFGNPISNEERKSNKELEKLIVGRQGTNFKARKEEYEALKRMAESKGSSKVWLYAPGEKARLWEECYKDGFICLGWDGLGDLNQYDSKEEIAQRLREQTGESGSKKNDATANYEFIAVASVGDTVIVKRGRHELLGYGIITSDYQYDDSRKEYKSIRNVDWKEKGSWKVNHSMALKTFTDITDYASGDPRYDQYYKRLLGIMNNEPQEIDSENKLMSLNTILYGPPGTGKTYQLNQLKEDYTDKAVIKGKKELVTEIAEQYPWWKLVAAVLFIKRDSKVPELVEHPVLLAKHNPDTPTKANQIIWGQLQSHSDNTNYSNKQGPIIFSKAEDSIWSVNHKMVEEELTDILDIVDEIKNTDKKQAKEEQVVERFNFVTFHQSFTYEDFVEGIKPKLSSAENELDDSSDLGYTIEKGIFYRACVESLKLAGYNSFTECYNDSKANRKAKFKKAKPYALFIDEINRGNISAIFGELITLIEADKRIGGDQEIWTSLPYDKSIKFSVPPNLYLIGTMNTADRSVEALDTALRRRFTFTEIAPNPDLLSSKYLVWKLFWDYKDSEWEDEPYLTIEKSVFNLLGVEEDFAKNRKVSIWDQWSNQGQNIDQISDLSEIKFTGVNFSLLLTTLNDRIELLIDKDHKIGHSYFLSVVGVEDGISELQNIFYNKVIPLLEEYFYGDFGKIGLVLGDQFVKKSQGQKVSFGKFEHEDQHLFKEKHLYEIIDYRNVNADAFLSAVKSIYDSNLSENE